MTERKDADFVGSFEKGLRVLRAFDAEHGAMTLSEVAERAGLTRAGARRFLLTLVELGYATSDGKHFSLTPRVLELGFAYLRALGLPQIVVPYLRRVSEELGESSSVAVLDDLHVVYVAREQTRRIMTTELGVGARLPACYTSMGRVLLAHLPPPERDERLARAELVAHTRHSLTSRAKLRAALAEARERGHCLVDQELEEGLRSLAVPLRDRQGRALAAMNVSAQANRVTVEAMRRTFLPALLRAAADVQQVLPLPPRPAGA
ncbi:MAG TPA: IclR family transcriptional regulator C-terminal domain-containing protein [Polyangiaceae bacterium]|nr:IclR family transcriptional regulator C-terminal domain-containing protein [Polyangiaceae bacterium]